MGLIFRLAELLIVLVPLAGALFAGWRAMQRATQPRDDAPTDGATATASDGKVPWRTITRIVDLHARTDLRWLDYELDVSKLLDYPLMTDVGHPLVAAFHKAKLRADLLRPARAEDLVDHRQDATDYLSAVEDYATAFDAAENEAIRLRRNGFPKEAQQRLTRAKSLLRVAADSTATAPERARAYELARNELDGLLVLPESTRLGLERGIAGELDG